MKYSKVLISIDDGPLADKVVSTGYDIAVQLEADVALLSVADTRLNMSEGNITPAELTGIIVDDFKKMHRDVIDKLGNDHIRSFVEEGSPHEIIIQVAEEWEADVIVIGTHGRTGLSHLLMGSVAEKVIRHSSKPCIIVPARH